jgi:hypothetical protein
MFAHKASVSPGTAVAAPQSNDAVTRPPETVQPAASQASAPAFSSFAKSNYDFSVIPVRAGMPSPPPKGAVDSPGRIGRRDSGDARTPAIVDDVLASPGHPLDAESRALAEPLFGRDFSHVRVHTGGRAAESAKAVDASAYTVGRHVVFDAGEGPASLSSSRGLLLHELAHTVQQQHAVSDRAPLRVSQPGEPYERQADAAVRAVLSGASIPTLGSSNAHIARQPKTKGSATAKGEEAVDTMAGAQVSQILVLLSEKRVGFQTSRGWVFGKIDTDLTEGRYELTPDIPKRRWVISKRAAPTGLRFTVDLEGAIPWTLAYPPTLPLVVTSGSPKIEEGEIPDIYALGYNTIYKKAGPASKAAVLALSSLETPRMFVDLDAYKKLAAPVRKSILDLEPHAAGTGCFGWFDVMRANDPDFKPKLTPEQIRAGDAAYYESMREARLGKRVQAAKADAPKLDLGNVEKKWNDNKYGLAAAAQTPNHGIKAEALQQIWVNYWADKVAVADKTLSAIIATEQRDHVDLSDTDTYRKATQVNNLGLYLLADSGAALVACRFADAEGKSLTLDEITERVLSHAKFMEGMQVFALALSVGGTGRTGPRPGGAKAGPIKTEPVKTEPVKTEPVKTEPVKTEPVKTEAAKTEPVKTEPAKTEPAKTEPGTGEKAEGGGRVVAGRSVKPRVATAKKYVWKNPRMSEGNYIEAELDGGVLDVTVKAGGPDDIRVGGSKMLDDVFDHFGADNIHEFDAKWVRNSTFRDNYDAYVQNLDKGMKPQEAAWNTWTGRQLKGRGFTSVEVPPHGPSPDAVKPVFKK